MQTVPEPERLLTLAFASKPHRHTLNPLTSVFYYIAMPVKALCSVDVTKGECLCLDVERQHFRHIKYCLKDISS